MGKRFEFVGEVSGTHREGGKNYALDGELVKFSFGDIIGNDGDFKVKICTKTYARNYGEETTLWLSEIRQLRD